MRTNMRLRTVTITHTLRRTRIELTTVPMFVRWIPRSASPSLVLAPSAAWLWNPQPRLLQP